MAMSLERLTRSTHARLLSTLLAAAGACAPFALPAEPRRGASQAAPDFVLDSVRTGEAWDFTVPAGAVVAENWRRRGAASDSFSIAPDGWTFALGDGCVTSLTVFSEGKLALPGGTEISPLPAPIGIVPARNSSMLLETDRQSLFWHSLSTDGSLLLTWWNVLLGRDAANPVSVQAELKPSGDVIFRYDFSRLGSDSLVADVEPSAGGILPDSPLSRSVTSVSFKSRNECVCNERRMAFYEVLGELDPFSCPVGSTNTVLEHVFYSGSVHGHFTYPQTTDDTAVMRVSVSGTGSGELLVGDSFVPLLGALRQDDTGASQESVLLVSVPRGVDMPLYIRGDGTLNVTFDSEEFAFGVLPRLALWRHAGWVNFPNTKASEPCIHDYTRRRRDVSLSVKKEAKDLHCTWQGSGDVEVENNPPRSASITAEFNARETGSVTYTLSHPKYLFGRTTYVQTVRFCPQPPEVEEDEHDPHWYGEGDHRKEGEPECWCCTWGTCGDVCACGCDCKVTSFTGGYDRDYDDECPVHGTPYENCAPLHYADYTNAVESVADLGDVLYIRDPPVVGERIRLDVPTEHVQCCLCPDHWTNSVTVAYKSHRLSVTDAEDKPFDVAYTSCTVNVSGISPSASVGDAGLSFCRNGEMYQKRGYTVLGVAIRSYGIPLDTYNELNQSFGFPMSVCTNVNIAPELGFVANVKLPDGDFRIELADASGQFAVWYRDNASMRDCKLLDTESTPVKDFPMDYWKALMRRAASGSDAVLPISITSASTGTVNLVFRYWNVVDGKLVKDEAVQRITSVNPPLLVDYDRDGKVGAEDVRSYLDGKPAYFWRNDDTWDGDDAFGFSVLRNSINSVVDGRCDMINFLPIAVDVAPFTSCWGKDSVYFRLEADARELRNAQLAMVDVDWTEIGDSSLGDGRDIDGVPLHEAQVSALGGGTNLPSAFVSLADSGRSTLLVEFPDEARNQNLVLKAYSKDDDVLLFSSRLNLHVGLVSDMIGWLNLRRVAYDSDSDGVPTRLSAPDWPADAHAPGNFVFVHGYNMAEDVETPYWAENVFKKLWWAGLDRGFIAVQWCGNDGQLYVPIVNTFTTPNYYRNVVHAFEAASSLKTELDDVEGPKWFLAHSLGNMLVSAAIQDHGMPHEKFFMLNAAVAMEALEPTAGITQGSHDCMTPGEWSGYVDKVRSTHWFECFPEGDGRRLLTWKGRFANVTNVVNFYSTQEEVVNNGDGKEHAVLVRDYVWYNQETRKGSWPAMLHGHEGGWGFNSLYDGNVKNWIGGELVEFPCHMPPADAAKLPKEQLRQAPFFLDFINPEMHSSSNGAIVAENYLYRAEMLAYAMPSESFAVGANPIPGHETMATNSPASELYFNYDMGTLFKSGINDLPENGEDPEDRHRDWQHSTFVQRSYKRVHQLYETIVKHVKEAENE